MQFAISTVLSKLEYFSMSQAVMYTVQVVISWNQQRQTLLLTESDISYMTYGTAAIPINLSDLEGYDRRYEHSDSWHETLSAISDPTSI